MVLFLFLFLSSNHSSNYSDTAFDTSFMILLASSESSRDITFTQSIKAQERPNLNSKSTLRFLYHTRISVKIFLPFYLLSSLCASRAFSWLKGFQRGSSCVWSAEFKTRSCKDLFLLGRPRIFSLNLSIPAGEFFYLD